MRRRQNLLLVLILIASLAACSGNSTPVSTATPTATFTPAPTMTPSPTFTPTLPPTLTPTITPRLTRTPIPTSTPFPAGFIASKDFGFSVVYSEGWKESPTENFFRLVNDDLGCTFLAFYDIEEVETPISTKIAAYRSTAQGLFISSKLDTQFTISLADGSKAQAAIVVGKNKDGSAVSMYLVSARQEPRTYTFLIYGPTQSFTEYRDSLDKLIKSIRLEGVQLYGADRSQTLLLLGYDPDPKELDPARTGSGAGDFVGLLYSGLVSLTPDLKITPDLAEDWIISPDGLVYTFTLRYDLAFQDERPLTAQDVKNSWERAADPKTKSDAAATYLGDIVGVKDKLAGKAKEISGVRVIDDRTLVVTLDGPKPYFLAKLTYPTSFVVDEKSITAGSDDWVFAPNASGPYKLLDYEKGNIIIFERNLAYHNPAKLPYIAFLLERPNTALSNYEGGEIDVTDWLTKEEMKKVHAADYPHQIEIQTATSMCTSMIQVNNTMPPMDDPNVRKAFALALDRQHLIDQFSGDNSLMANTVLPPAIPGFSADLRADTFDPKAAKDALAASRYAGKMPKIVLNSAGYANQPSNNVNALIDMWRKNLGVSVEVEYLDPTDYTRTAREQHGQLVLDGWCADYPDPENFLDVLFHTGSNFNSAGYTNPEVDKLLEHARVESDPTQRLELYQKVESLLLSDNAAIPMSHGIETVLVKPGVKGFILSPMSTRILDLIWLEE